MCGIFGTVNTPLDAARCLLALQHRGPDSNGVQCLDVGGASVVLGHTRLAILDLSPAGHQPIASQDKRWCVSYNGEIYNHLELRKHLDVSFRGHSDTETLVEYLAAYGIGPTVQAVNGMFAFAAVDQYERKLYLVRDPFGIKPVYYTLTEGFAFASEIRALAVAASFRPAIDLDALQCYLTLRFVPSPRTLWHGIYRLPAGHVLSVDLQTGQHALSRYVEPTTTRFTGDIQEAVETYHDLLSRAINRQLLSDVPVGVLLSGGVDSALIAALAKEQGHALPCYTVGYHPNHPESEIPWAAETARVLGLPFIPVTITPEDIMASLDSVTMSLEEPIVSTGALAMWHLVQRARQDVTVALTGQGSDEPWGGYTRYQNEMLRRLIPIPVLLHALRPARRVWQRMPEFVDRALRSLPIRERLQRFEEAYALFTTSERQTLTGRSDDGQALQDIAYWADWNGGVVREPVEDMMRVDARTCLPDDWLLYGDKVSMAFSLETRVPILDVDVVCFIESLPRPYRVGLAKRKVVHKMMAKRLLPPAIVNRRKQGFPTPFVSWSRGPLRKRVTELLLEELPRDGLVQRDAIERLLRDHFHCSRDVGRQIYALFTLANWRRQFAV